MMRGAICVLLLLGALLLMPAESFAAEKTYTYTPDTVEIEADTAKALEKILPNELGEAKNGWLDAIKKGIIKFDANEILDRLYTSVKGEMMGPLSLLCTLVSLVICSAVFRTLSQAVKNSGVGTAFALCSSLCFCGAICVPVVRIAERTAEFLHWLASFITALVPVFSSLYLAGGSVASAAYASSGAYMLTVFIEQIFAEVLLPVCKLLLALSLVSALSPLDLSGIIKVIKNTFSTSLAFLMMLNSAVYSLGNHIAAANDGLAMRTVRFAAGSFIPVVGGAVSEAMRTVAGSLAVIKTGVGWVCCAAVIFVLLPPIVAVLLYRTAIELAGAAAKMCLLGTEARLLDGAVAVCNLLAALMASAAVLFVLAITLFVKTAVV